MTNRIRTIYTRSKVTYGAARIHAELISVGVRVGRKRVARLMKAAHLRGVSRRKYYPTTQGAQKVRPAPDLVQPDFRADRPNQLWLADITYITTWVGRLYLAVVLDVCSRRVVGWAMATHLRTQLVLDALQLAITQRHPEDVIHHSDQGSQYTSLAFGNQCHKAGIIPSMGSVGDCYDNAICESFFATLECELLDRYTFPTIEEARRALFGFIDGWYNPHRRHSSIEYLSPINYERAYAYTITSPSLYVSIETG